jgi:N-formylglutamate deformylase
MATAQSSPRGGKRRRDDEQRTRRPRTSDPGSIDTSPADVTATTAGGSRGRRGPHLPAVPRQALFTSRGLNTATPVIAFAIHNGHHVRSEIRSHLAIPSAARKREEDPFTGEIAAAVEAHVVVQRSRFEVDLNRPPERAVYAGRSEAWGLDVWRRRIPLATKRESLFEYRAFYGATYAILADFEHRFGRFLVLDIHSYNHRRDGPDAPPSSPRRNPDVNVGSSPLNRELWAPLVRRFNRELASARGEHPALDVRENVRFRGSHFVTWVHQNFPGSGCALALEFKKTFMDEWTGRVDRVRLRVLRARLRRATLASLAELERMR